MKPPRTLASRLRHLIRIERPQADTSLDGAGSGNWPVVDAEVPAEIEDMLPSRGERLANGINVATRPARVRMRYRTDITAAMRFVDITDGTDGRVMQIIAGPAMLGRDAVEFMVEDYSTSGNAA